MRANSIKSTLITGHNKGIVKLFDINRPDEAPLSLEIKLGKSRQHAPISSIDYSSTDHNLSALGTFDSRIFFNDQRNFKRVMNYLKMPSGRGVS